MKPSPMFTHLLKALCVAFVLSLLCTELAEASAGKDTRGHDNRHNKEKHRQKAARTLGTKAFVSTPSKTISKAWCLVTGSAPSAESRAELAILTAVMGSSPHTTINVASEYEDEPTLKSGILEKVKESNCKYTFISTGGTGTGMNFDRKKGKIDLNKVKIKWHVEKQGEKEPDEFWQQLRAESPFGTSACSCQIDPQLTHVCMNRANSPLSFNGRHGFLLLPRGDIDNEEEMKTYQHIQDQTSLTKQTMPAWFKAVHGLQEQKRAKVCFAQLAFTVKAGELAVDYYSFEPSNKKGVPFELIKATHDECN